MIINLNLKCDPPKKNHISDHFLTSSKITRCFFSISLFTQTVNEKEKKISMVKEHVNMQRNVTSMTACVGYNSIDVSCCLAMPSTLFGDPESFVPNKEM